jgi:hypothetical protein
MLNKEMLILCSIKMFDWQIDVTVSDFRHSYHLPIVFHILDHIRARDFSNRAEKFIDWERFRNLASKLISPRIQINLGEGDWQSRLQIHSLNHLGI